MAVIDLQKYSGLALSFDNIDLIADEGSIEVGEKTVVKISDMRRQLLNTNLSCPVIFYAQYVGVDRKSVFRRKNLKLSVLLIPQNLAGIEYVKTKGMRVGDYPVLIEVIYGFATIIMQTSDYDRVTEETKTMTIKLVRGEKYVIPPGSDFIIVNTRQSPSVVATVRSAKGSMEPVFDDARGSAHYIIRKNARQEIVQNPYYRRVVRLRVCRPCDLYKFFGLTAKTPVFKQILRKYERFRWLHDSSKINWNKVPRCS